MTKTIKLIGTGFVGVACFIYVTFTIIHMTKINSKVDEWEESYRAIEKDIDTFVRVSDPKTTQFYINELEKIVDNIHMLGKIINEGDGIGSYLDNLKEQIDASIMVFEDQYNHMYNAHERLSYDVDELYDGQEGINGRLESLSFAIESVNDGINERLNVIVKDINDIKNKLKTMNKDKLFHNHVGE